MGPRALSHANNRRMRVLVISIPPIPPPGPSGVVAKTIVHELDSSRRILRENEVPLFGICMEKFESFTTCRLDSLACEFRRAMLGVRVAVEVLGEVFTDGGVERFGRLLDGAGNNEKLADLIFRFGGDDGQDEARHRSGRVLPWRLRDRDTFCPAAVGIPIIEVGPCCLRWDFWNLARP
jgi:hypothetical protein